MKTSLAIVLAVAALTISAATVSAHFEHRRRGRGRTRKWCGGRVPTEEIVRRIGRKLRSGASRSLNRRGRLAAFDYGGPR